MNKILCVGGSGFIGSYILREIKADNLDLKVGQDMCDGIYQKYKTIIFLACNQANTHEAYEENCKMYNKLDEYRHKHPYTKLIFISSAAVYNSTSIYAQSKRMGEVYAKRFRHHLIFRLSNVYGHGDGHGAPDKFLNGEKEIYGTGMQVRDLISVEEVTDAILYAANMQPESGIYNISSGEATSVNEMFKLFGVGKPKYNSKHDYGVDYSRLDPGRVE